MGKKKPIKKRCDADRRVRQCERLARLMRTLHLIMGKGRWDANALADELDCSRRTVHRLLQTLTIAGVPWYFDKTIRAYKVRPGYKFPLLEEQLLTESKKQCLPKEVDLLAEKVIKDGEVFAESLEQFLTILRQLNRQR